MSIFMEAIFIFWDSYERGRLEEKKKKKKPADELLQSQGSEEKKRNFSRIEKVWIHVSPCPDFRWTQLESNTFAEGWA